MNVMEEPASSLLQREALCEVCRALSARGLIAGAAGNVSMRLDAGRVLATPSGGAKGLLAPESLIVLDLKGQVIAPAGGRASSEIQVHLALYAASAEVGAVVHAHPVVSTALAGLEEVNLCVTAEGAASVGGVALIPYLRPGTRDLADACGQMGGRGAVTLLLEKHGAVTVGKTLEEAWLRMESLEHVARVWQTLHGLHGGAPPTLKEAEVQALREQVGVSRGWPAAAVRWR